MNRKWNKFSDKLPDQKWIFVSNNNKVSVETAQMMNSEKEGFMRYWNSYGTCHPDSLWASLRLPNPPGKDK